MWEQTDVFPTPCSFIIVHPHDAVLQSPKVDKSSTRTLTSLRAAKKLQLVRRLQGPGLPDTNPLIKQLPLHTPDAVLPKITLDI